MIEYLDRPRPSCCCSGVPHTRNLHCNGNQLCNGSPGDAGQTKLPHVIKRCREIQATRISQRLPSIKSFNQPSTYFPDRRVGLFRLSCISVCPASLCPASLASLRTQTHGQRRRGTAEIAAIRYHVDAFLRNALTRPWLASSPW
jgi:hypothetical protein